MTSKPKPERQIKFKLNKEDRNGSGKKGEEKKIPVRCCIYDDLIL